ncbi:hypothetical protein KR200_010255, partial [Drosophila serrata]
CQEYGLIILIFSSARPDTVGALVANRQGLCLVAKGDIDPNVSGIGMAIAQQVAKLEPKSTVPATICLYSGNKFVHFVIIMNLLIINHEPCRRCVIRNDGRITAVIFKQLTAESATTATG